MKRIIVLLLVLSLMVVGCSKNDASTASDGAVTLTLAHHLSETDSNNILAQEFARLVNERSNGRITIDIYPNNQLGGQRELLEGLGAGTVDFSMSDTGLLGNYDPVIGILELPYNYNTIDEARAVVEGELGDLLTERILDISKIEMLTLEVVAFRDTILRDKDIVDAASFDGLKVRVPENPILVSTYQAFGANPTVIPSGEAYTAVETGVVDGMEGNKEFLADSVRIFEVAKKWFYTKHGISITCINMGPLVHDKLTEEDIAMIRQAAVDALPVFYKYTADLDKRYTELLAENGMKFFEVDTDSLRKAAKPVIDNFLSQDPLYAEYYDNYIVK